MALNARQISFVNEYLKDKNASRAAKDAGYSARTAGVQGHELLKNPEISKAIQDSLFRASELAELTAGEVLAEIRKLAMVDLTSAYDREGRLLPLHELPERVKASIISIETDEIFVGKGPTKIKIGVTKRIRIADKVRALEMLAKHYKLLTEVHEITGKNGEPIFIALPTNDSENPIYVYPSTPKPPEPVK